MSEQQNTEISPEPEAPVISPSEGDHTRNTSMPKSKTDELPGSPKSELLLAIALGICALFLVKSSLLDPTLTGDSKNSGDES